MHRHHGFVLAAIAGLVALATPAEAQESKAAPAALACQPQGMPLEGRASPYDSATVAIGELQAKVCYGRPSARGRTMIGGEHVPFGQLWRTGANEPTTIHLASAATIAGIAVEPGSYSIYTIPGTEEWTVIVNRSTSQWGHESRYTEEVEAQEVGRATVRSEALSEHVETFTIRSVEKGAGKGELVLEWEMTRVRIPIEPQG